MVTEVVASEVTANCEIRKAKHFKPTADIHTFPLEKLRTTWKKTGGTAKFDRTDSRKGAVPCLAFLECRLTNQEVVTKE